ncbi:MAG: TetR family transcriptional regulator [Actinobacteria bacterium]|nr:TetR family transcriptional regulator [Actinomycetota bacterium]
MEAARQAIADPEKLERRLDSEKAQRIVAAMRDSVARRGAAGSTFDHVAQEAGVSRGLLHYYFGTKERLLVEVVRRDADIRIHALEERLRGAGSLDAVVQALVAQLQEFVAEDAGSHAVIHELLSAARRNDEIREELAELYRRVRSAISSILTEKEREGIVSLRGGAEAVASILLALGDGLEVQLTSDPDWDGGPTVGAGVSVARFLLGAD